MSLRAGTRSASDLLLHAIDSAAKNELEREALANYKKLFIQIQKLCDIRDELNNVTTSYRQAGDYINVFKTTLQIDEVKEQLIPLYDLLSSYNSSDPIQNILHTIYENRDYYSPL